MVIIQPTDEFLALGKRAYEAYGGYDACRMKVYSYLRMPAPEIEVLPSMRLRSGSISYCVKMTLRDCSLCDKKYTVLRHKAYLELYPRLPFLCEHEAVISDMVVSDHIEGDPIQLPMEIDYYIPEGGRRA